MLVGRLPMKRFCFIIPLVSAKIMCLSCTRCPKKIVLRLCGYCGGALNPVTSVFAIFTLLHWLNFNLEFETLCESIRQVVDELLQRKEVVASKTAFVLFSSNVKIEKVCEERVLVSY